MLSLDIGGGPNPFKNRSEEWKDSLNIDIQNITEVDVVCDVSKGLPFLDNTVDKIITCHFIEHIGFKEQNFLFNECYRVLKNEGFILIIMPEFDICIKEYLRSCFCVSYNSSISDPKCNICNGKASISRQRVKEYIYGNQCYPYDYHLNMMTSEEALIKMINSGFKNIKVEPGGGPLVVHITGYKL